MEEGSSLQEHPQLLLQPDLCPLQPLREGAGPGEGGVGPGPVPLGEIPVQGLLLRR